MKKNLLTFLTIVSLSTLSLAQAPEKFSYQAVIRDPSSNLVANQIIGVQMKIRQGLVTGTVVYSETFLISTNSYGLINLEIGNGITMDNFQTIDWANGPFYIETLTDITGGSSYVSMGTSQLLSVPYALHAKSAETVINDQVDDADADPTNELQTLSISGNEITLSNGGGTVAIPGTLHYMGTTSNIGANPSTTSNFIGPYITVVITSTSQKVHWTATKALGSTTGANSLVLYPAYRLSSSSTISSVGSTMLGISCAADTRQPYTIAGTITNLTPGTYLFGMGGYSPNAVNWNLNEYGYVSIMVFN